MDSGVFYESVGSNTISLSGVISWSENAGTDYDLVLTITNAGTEKYREVIASYVATGAFVQRRAVIAKTLTLADLDRVALRLESTGTSTDIEVIFNTDTHLNISNKEDKDHVRNSECYGLTVYEAFSALSAQMGLGFKSEFFSKGQGVGDFLTSGNNVRGILSNVNLSLEWLFVQLSRIYNLELNLKEGVISIEKAVNRRAIWLDKSPDGYIENTDIDKLYSKVKAGYSKWQSESKMKGVEFNSMREYETELAYGSRELNLVVDIVTSGYMIEEQRRLQFDVQKSKEGGKYDEDIFLIALDGNVVERLDKYNPVLNVLPSGGVYNFKYSPARVMENNADNLKNLGEIEMVSAQGNSGVSAAGIREDKRFNYGDKRPLVASFETVIDTADFNDLDEIIFNHCGVNKSIKILDASMSLQPDGKGFITITGEVK